MSKRNRVASGMGADNSAIDAAVETELVPVPEIPVTKRTRKLAKVIEGNILTITEADTGTVLTFDAAALPAEIQANLMPYGLTQKLGDAAAGKKGKDAVDAIQKVYDGLAAGNWSVRAPASPKISKNDIMSTYNAMEEGAEKEIFKGLLIKLQVLPANA